MLQISQKSKTYQIVQSSFFGDWTVRSSLFISLYFKLETGQFFLRPDRIFQSGLQSVTQYVLQITAIVAQSGFLTIRNKPYSHKPYGHNHMTIYGHVWPYENKLASGHNTHSQSSLLGF